MCIVGRLLGTTGKPKLLPLLPVFCRYWRLRQSGWTDGVAKELIFRRNSGLCFLILLHATSFGDDWGGTKIFHTAIIRQQKTAPAEGRLEI